MAMLSEVADEVLIVGPGHIEDLVPGCGPMGGVHAADLCRRHDAVFVIACDMPYVHGALCRSPARPRRRRRCRRAAHERGLHPLCAVYTRACREPLARRLAADRCR
jgi:molybdopterin-guanine dinucleotide biosynthesis protein A